MIRYDGSENMEKIVGPIEDYKDIDWKVATYDTFIRMYWPRGSELGHIHADEASLFIDVCFRNDIKQILEIGSMFGVSTRLLAALTKRNDGYLYTIDAGMTDHVEVSLRTLNLLSNTVLIKEWSPWVTPIHIWSLDLLFIDGDHSLISILTDYHYFNYYLNKGGFVAFHDMNMPECQQAVELIKKRDPLELVGSAGRLMIFKKLTERGEKYFQVINRQK